MNRNQQAAAYQERIKELHQELEETAKLVSAERGSLDSLKSQIAVSTEHLQTVDRAVAKALELFDQAEEAFQAKKQQISELHRSQAEIELGHMENLDVLAKRQAELSPFVDKHRGIVDSIMAASKEKLALDAEIVRLEDEISALNAQIKKSSSSLDEKKLQLDEREAEIDAKVKKNESILTQIEYDKMKLQAYVRLLQNYYDETGIRLFILKEFGLETK